MTLVNSRQTLEGDDVERGDSLPIKTEDNVICREVDSPTNSNSNHEPEQVFLVPTTTASSGESETVSSFFYFFISFLIQSTLLLLI